MAKPPVPTDTATVSTAPALDGASLAGLPANFAEVQALFDERTAAFLTPDEWTALLAAPAVA